MLVAPEDFCRGLADTLRTARERARALLLSEGMPVAVVDGLMHQVRDMHAGQIALAEKTIAEAEAMAQASPSIRH
jgi:hypothetical protein